MKSLADKYPEAVAAMTAQGLTHIPAMMARFTRCADMDRALGTHGAVNNWCLGKNVPQWAYELQAKHALAALDGADPAPAPEATPGTAPAAAPQETTLLVVVKGDAAKAVRVLALLGCETVEI